MKLRVGCLCLTAAILWACSSRHTPAPVAVLDSQPVSIPSAFESETYTVVSGDTLFAIAWYSGNDYRDLATWNKIAAPYTLSVGQTLRLRPPQKQLVETAPATRPSGPTRQKITNKVIESSKRQAYGESVKENVQKNDPKSKTGSRLKKYNIFPKKVDRWLWPAKGKVVEKFQQTGNVNKGIDIQAQAGSPIKAAAAGRVVYTGNALRGYGNLVIIKHTETFLTAYAHNDKILVSERKWVDAGEQIATMGSTGTNLVKLHFEVRYRGKSLDPMRYLPAIQ